MTTLTEFPARRRSANPFRAERLGGFLPFVWYGTCFSAWMKVLASSGGEITLNRLPNVVGVTLAAPLASAFRLASELLYRSRAEAVTIKPPIFVLGHFRTGTTYLQDLLACDQRYGYPTTFQCAFPNSLLIGERALAGLFSMFLPKKRPMDDVPVGSALPLEDEFAIMKLGLGSPYLTFAFARRGPQGMAYLTLEDLTDEERQRWEDGFLWLIRRIQLAQPEKRLVLKSPPHTARVKTLLKLFPEARFIHLARNPFDVYPSTRRLWKIMNSRQGFQNPPDDEGWMNQFVLSTCEIMYDAYLRDRMLIPEGRLIEIQYESLVADPLGVLGHVYSGLDLGDFAEVSPAVQDYVAGLGEYRPRLHQLGEAERRTIRDRWGFYFDNFGYQRREA